MNIRRALSIFGFFPSVWPVVQRELRSRARKPRYFVMRVLGGVAAMFIVYWALQHSMSPSETSIMAFGNLALLVLALILLMVPTMTSDCLSREKREGTLGLLFLTPLTPAGIVIGKCATQALLAWSLWVSVLPAMAFPVLLGGLTWKNIVIAVVFQFGAVLISLAAGLLASCLTPRRNMALFYAAALAGVFVSSILLSISIFGFTAVAVESHVSCPEVIERVRNELSERGIPAMVSDGFSGVIYLLTRQLSPRSPTLFELNIILTGVLCTAFSIFLGAIWFAARHIRKTWCDKPASPQQRWLTQRFCTVLFRDSFRRKMQRSLDANPIAWLEQYSWKARITKWGLCLLFIVIELWAIPSDASNLDRMRSMQMPLLLILAAVATVAGVGSFRSEKESGALELILITPLRVNEIIFGRVIGWWRQLLPAALIFLIFTTAVQWAMIPNNKHLDPVDLILPLGFFATVYLSLPFFAVYSALRAKYFIVAVALALLGVALEFAFGIELAVMIALHSSHPNYTSLSFVTRSHAPTLILVLICTIVSAAAFVRLTFFLLRHSLSRRIYSF